MPSTELSAANVESENHPCPTTVLHCDAFEHISSPCCKEGQWICVSSEAECANYGGSPPPADNNVMSNDFSDVNDANDEGPRVIKGGLRASLLVVGE
jgi:hypothetical protein